MKTSTITKLMPLGALALTAAPLQAITPQEAYAALIQTVATPATTAESRAASMPALALLPQKSESMLIMPKFDAKVQMISKLKGNKCCGSAQDMENIGCVVWSAGEGSAESMKQLLSIIYFKGTMRSLDPIYEGWGNSARESFFEPIESVFEAAGDKLTQELKANLKAWKVAPMYVALTAAPGKEDAFNAKVDELVAKILEENDKCDVTKVEQDGFVGVKFPRSQFLSKIVSHDAMEDPEVKQLVDEGSIYVLVKKSNGAMVWVVCSDPADIKLPAGPADSLAASPLSDVKSLVQPVTEMHGAFLVGPELCEAYSQIAQSSYIKPIFDVVAGVFDKLAEVDAPNAAVYTAASSGVKTISSKVFPKLPGITKPMVISLWQVDDNNLSLQISGDGGGTHFEDGELRYASLAAAPETQIYMESTAVVCSNGISLDIPLSVFFDIAKGYALSLREDEKDILSDPIQTAESFTPEIQAVGDALSTVAGGLKAPFSLVVSETGSTVGSGSVSAVAISSAVKDRAALSAGWEKLLNAAQQISDKMGKKQNISAMLPIMPFPMDNGAISYVLALPIPEVAPQITVSDKSMILGTNTALNKKLITLANEPAVPFHGAVMSVNYSSFVHGVKDDEDGSAKPSPLLIKSVSGVMTDKDGLFLSNWNIEIQPSAE